MPRLTTPYTAGLPILRLAIDGPNGARDIAGVLDSGADRTLLPMSVAASLGIPAEDLMPTDGGSGGAGGLWFPTWALTYPLCARVVAPFDRGDELWGPDLALMPEFAKHDDTVALFGREDVFCTYAVTFDQPASAFYIEYPDSN